MNVVPLDPVLPEDLRRRLAALPDFAPPPALRERVAARSWAAPARPARGWLALAAMLLVAVGAGVALRAARDPADAAVRMAALERDVLALRVSAAAGSPAVAALEGELARIDRALAASFAAAAPAAERDALWRDRESVLVGLRQAYRAPERMIRI
jgi:hypothetical protein